MRLSPSLKRRPGFAMLWVIMTIAVVAAIGAVSAPILAAAYDRQRVEAAYTMLAAIDSGINAFEQNVRTGGSNTNQFPGRVSQLAIPITSSSQNSCDDVMGGNAPSRWAAEGPFIRFFADTGGVYTPIGRIRDEIERIQPPRSNPLIVQIPDVDVSLIELMDLLVDEGDGGFSGKVLFNPFSPDETWLFYLVTPRQADKR